MMNNSRTKPQPKGGLTWEREKAVIVAAFVFGLLSIALISVGYILPGLVLPCRSAGEDLPAAEWLLKSGIALAVILVLRLRTRPEAPDKDEPPARETRP